MKEDPEKWDTVIVNHYGYTVKGTVVEVDPGIRAKVKISKGQQPTVKWIELDKLEKF